MVTIDTDSRVAQIPGQLATPEAPHPARGSLDQLRHGPPYLPGGRAPGTPTNPARVRDPLPRRPSRNQSGLTNPLPAFLTPCRWRVVEAKDGAERGAGLGWSERLHDARWPC